MQRRRNRLSALAFAGLLLGAIATASLVAWRVLIERWYIAQLESPSLMERRSAVERLAAMRSVQAVPGLARVVATSEDAELRIIGLRALAALGRDAESAVPALVDFLVAYKPDKGRLRGPYKIASKIHFGSLHCPEEIDWVFPRLLDPVQTELAATLAALGPACVPPLVDALKETRLKASGGTGESFGFTALTALIHLGEASVDPLLDALDDKGNYSLQCGAVYALCQIGAPAVPALLERLSKGSESTRKEAARILGKIGAPAAPALLERLSEGSESERNEAACLLGEIGIGTMPVLECLERLLDNPEWTVQTAALYALACVRPEATVQVDRLADKLLKLIDGEYPRLRRPAVRALGRLSTVARAQVRVIYDRYRNAPTGDRQSFTNTIELLDTGAVPFLIEDLDSKDATLAVSSQSLLWQIAATNREAHRELVDALGGLQPPIRDRVTKVLDLIDTSTLSGSQRDR